MFENTWHQWLRGLCKASLLKRVRNGRAVSSKPPRRRYVLELEALEARIVPAPVVGGAGEGPLGGKPLTGRKHVG